MSSLISHVSRIHLRTSRVKRLPDFPLVPVRNRFSSNSKQSYRIRENLIVGRTGNNVANFKSFTSRLYASTCSGDNKDDARFDKSRNSSEVTKENRIWTVPNLLCVARIASAPFLGYFILNSQSVAAVTILIASGLTDFADGFIARNFSGQSSRLGTFLDPLADKIFIITLYGCLTYTNAIPGILAALVIFRDITLIIAGLYIKYLSLSYPRTLKKLFDGSQVEAQLFPTYLSKINTVVQLSTAVLSLSAPIFSIITPDVLLYSWYIAGFSTIASGISYAIRRDTFSIPSKR